MSLQKFRYMDLTVLSLLGIISEAIIVLFLKYNMLNFYLSFASMIFIIASIRWGFIAVICYMLAGVPALILSPIDGMTLSSLFESLLYFVVANSFIAIPIFIYGKRDRNLIMKKPIRVISYILLSHITLSLGKGLIILLIDNYILGFLQFFLSMIFSIVISIILCLIFNWRKMELLCDMSKYIKQQQEDMEDTYGS